MIQIENLRYSYPKAGKMALDGLSLEVSQGEALGLIGPNGAGKTTLVSVLMGLKKVQSGRVDINGQKPLLGRPDIAIVPQEYAFYNELTVIENMTYFATLIKSNERAKLTKQRSHPSKSLKTISTNIDHRLSQTGLMDLKARRAGSLSGGEKRKLNIAIGLLQAANILILDEPSANVDPLSRQDILNLIQQLTQAGNTIIFTSHLLTEVEKVCSQLAMINQGKLILTGPIDEVLTKQKSELHVKFGQLNETQKYELEKISHGLFDKSNILVVPLNKNIGCAIDTLSTIKNHGFEPINFHCGSQSLEKLFISAVNQIEASEA